MWFDFHPRVTATTPPSFENSRTGEEKFERRRKRESVSEDPSEKRRKNEGNRIGAKDGNSLNLSRLVTSI